jgi:hypothetical protein
MGAQIDTTIVDDEAMSEKPGRLGDIFNQKCLWTTPDFSDTTKRGRIRPLFRRFRRMT